MPEYRLTLTFQDELNGQTTRTYVGTFADDATADSKASALMTDFNTATNAGIEKAELTKDVTPASIVGAGSRVFEVAKLVCRLDNTKLWNLKIPSPIASMFSGNTVNIGDAVVTNLVANFATGEWNVSETNFIDTVVKGERAFVASGKTNLPA